MERPKRRHPRLKGYDYARNGAYFVTFCTRDKRCILAAVGRGALAPPLRLTEYGEIVDGYIRRIPLVYPNVVLENYVVMPNHVHLLLRMEPESGGARAPRPTVQMVVGGVKSLTTRAIGRPIWQASFYDHVIRDEGDYLRIWEYIASNPAKWGEDCYYVGDAR